MNSEVLASDNTLWVLNSIMSDDGYGYRVWSSTDGISWHRSAAEVPSGMDGPTLVDHDNALWSFFKNDFGGECWKSSNHGDSWTLVSTNLPAYTDTVMTGYQVISHDDRLWLWGEKMGMETALLWSTNAIEWETSLIVDGFSESKLFGLPNGRLWFVGKNMSMMDQILYYAGGPKKDDGLYYYKKD